MDPASPGPRTARAARAATRQLGIAVTDARGRPQRAPGLAAWLRRVAPPSAKGDVAIVLVSDQRIRTLNRDYRRKDQPTDVLSFPADPGPYGPSALGDIVIATGVARRQARDAGHSYASELKILALHGLLHLIGYDHDAPADHGRMARVERRLRAKGGLHAGLIERVERASVVSQRPERGRERAQRSEPRERREPAKRRARARAGESEGRSRSVKT